MPTSGGYLPTSPETIAARKAELAKAQQEFLSKFGTKANWYNQKNQALGTAMQRNVAPDPSVVAEFAPYGGLNVDYPTFTGSWGKKLDLSQPNENLPDTAFQDAWSQTNVSLGGRITQGVLFASMAALAGAAVGGIPLGGGATAGPGTAVVEGATIPTGLGAGGSAGIVAPTLAPLAPLEATKPMSAALFGGKLVDYAKLAVGLAGLGVALKGGGGGEATDIATGYDTGPASTYEPYPDYISDALSKAGPTSVAPEIISRSDIMPFQYTSPTPEQIDEQNRLEAERRAKIATSSLTGEVQKIKSLASYETEPSYMTRYSTPTTALERLAGVEQGYGRSRLSPL